MFKYFTIKIVFTYFLLVSQINSTEVQLDPEAIRSGKQSLFSKDINIVSKLLDIGANPNIPNKFGHTPLMNASGDLEITKLLISKGANVNMKNEWRQNALTYAVLKNNLEVVEELIAAQIEINFIDFFGSSPLLLAARRGYSEIIKKLLENGAKLDDNSYHYIIQNCEDYSELIPKTENLTFSLSDLTILVNS